MNCLRENQKRIIAILLAIIVSFAFMSAVFFIGIEADHDCTGEDCLICFQISNCNNILKSFGSLLSISATILCILIFSAELYCYKLCSTKHSTLVSLYIKLSA